MIDEWKIGLSTGTSDPQIRDALQWNASQLQQEHAHAHTQREREE